MAMAIVDIVSIIRMQRAAEQLGEKSDEEEADAGHAGADDAHVDLDVWPLGNVQVVPCWVVRFSEVDERLKA